MVDIVLWVVGFGGESKEGSGRGGEVGERGCDFAWGSEKSLVLASGSL